MKTRIPFCTRCATGYTKLISLRLKAKHVNNIENEIMALILFIFVETMYRHLSCTYADTKGGAIWENIWVV